MVCVVLSQANARTNHYEGTCVIDEQHPRPYSQTEMAHHFPTSSAPPLSTYCTGVSMTLLNGDTCRIGDWVLFTSNADNVAAPSLGRICEIIVSADAASVQRHPRPDAILVQRADITPCMGPYRMPSVRLSSNWVVLNVLVSD